MFHLLSKCMPLALVAAMATGCERSDPVSASGTISPESVVLLGSNGDRVWPFQETQDKVKVFAFVRTDCPVSNRYAPEVRRLYELHSPDEVSWWLVYPNPHVLAKEIQEHLAEFNYPCRALHDGEHQLVNVTGATVTPEVAVYDRTNNLVYCGRIDDRYVEFGRQRPEPTTHDLENAIDVAIDGRTAEPLRTKAIGCYIKDLR